jgi:phosphomannomutase
MNVTPLPDQIFREYDIRGTYGASLTDQVTLIIGQKLGTLFKNQGIHLVCVGRDGRLSSPSLHQYLVQGLRQTGINVLDIGVGPTPMVYFATQETPAQAGIMITGSHNPKNDNGFKICLKDQPFFGSNIQKLKNHPIELALEQGTLEHIDVREFYAQRLLSGYQHREKELRIAWDPGNGAAGEITSLLVQNLAGKHFVINEQIDGNFPAHHPDPAEEKNLEQLRDLMNQHHCDLGIAFDGDADRIGVIDHQGRIIWPDQLLILLGREILRKHPGAQIIADVKSSQALFDEITKAGGQAIMSRTGHSLIKKMIKETGALLAGEMSGHIFFADEYYGYDDGLYTAIRLLNLLQSSHVSLAEMIDDLPKYFNTPEMRFPCPDEKKFQVIEQLSHHLQEQGITFNNTDGVRVSTPVGWWLLRASNTGPALIARCEADSPENLEKMQHDLNKYLRMFSS